MLPEKTIKEITKLRKSGLGVKTIARNIGADPKTVRRYMSMDKANVVTEKQTASEPKNTQENGGNLFSQVFALLDEGQSPVEIVKTLNLPPDTVKQLVIKWDELKGLELNDKSLMNKIVSIEKEIAALRQAVSGTPLLGFKRVYKCRNCGSTGYLALNIQCTSCKDESWWGWIPPRQEEGEEDEQEE